MSFTLQDRLFLNTYTYEHSRISGYLVLRVKNINDDNNYICNLQYEHTSVCIAVL